MPKQTFEALPFYDKLLNKIRIYYSTIWKDKRDGEEGIYESWLTNFIFPNDDIQAKQRLHALYLLSKFMYFGSLELRELLKSIYRDLFKYPIVSKIRKDNNDTIDISFLESEFSKELGKTRFLGIGNPSESGVHLLYYFRQENDLSREHFINTHQIFKNTIVNTSEIPVAGRNQTTTELKDTSIKRYIFIDDFCGSGSQAKEYSTDVVRQIKQIDPSIEVCYFMLFSTEFGLNEVKKTTQFDVVESIFTIDETFKCFNDKSRYFCDSSKEIDKSFCKQMCEDYGRKLDIYHPLGFKDGQLLLGLFHNTPDNTLPIFWSNKNWKPVFKRYHKIY